jgi:hypothetical protein
MRCNERREDGARDERRREETAPGGVHHPKGADRGEEGDERGGGRFARRVARHRHQLLLFEGIPVRWEMRWEEMRGDDEMR